MSAPVRQPALNLFHSGPHWGAAPSAPSGNAADARDQNPNLISKVRTYLTDRGFSAVRVTAQQQRIILAGMVSSQYERLLVLQSVRRLVGNLIVADNLRVAVPRSEHPALLLRLRRAFGNWVKTLRERLPASHWLMAFSSVFAVGVLLCAWLPGHAGDADIPVVPVTGSVQFVGRIPEGAQLIFHPRGHSLPEGTAAVAKVQQDGTFQASISSESQGLPPGHYTVTLFWYRSPGIQEGSVVNVFPQRYSRPDSSPVQVTVRGEAPQNLPPIQITSY